MPLKHLSSFFVPAAMLLYGISCNPPVDSDSDAPVVTVTVRSGADSTSLPDANVILYDANTNEPVSRAFSDGGSVGFKLSASGNYYLKIEAQGYYPVPPPGGAPLPFQINAGEKASYDFYLSANPAANGLGGFGGYIKTADNKPVMGALVIAVSSYATVSGTSGPDGYFVFYNIAPGSYSIESHLSGYLQQESDANVTATAASFTANSAEIKMNAGTFGTVSGHVSFVAAANPDQGIDVTLIHPEAREAVPGLSTFIDPSSGSYTIPAVPYETYIAWASYRNDGYVMDPDAIRKFGSPAVTLSPSHPDTSIDFKVTGAVRLVSPTNPPDSVYPVDVATTTPAFTWVKTSSYASTKEYVVEVFDRSGRTIWGGFDSSGVIRHQKIAPDDTNSVVFNFDGSAIDSLHPGEVYRWKVYADDDADPNVQTLLSASEYLMGLFRVAPDEGE